MDKFWEYLEKSILVQASVTLIFVVTTCYLWVTGRPIPTLLAGTLGTVLGFWFGSKTQQWINHKTRR